MARPSKYPTELRERAVRMVTEHKKDYSSEYEAIRSIATKLGIRTPETLRKWVRQTEESEQLKALKRENAELRRANEILKAASAFFAAELDRPHRY
jgi:transposase